MGTWCTLEVEKQRRKQELVDTLKFQREYIKKLEAAVEKLKEKSNE